MPRPGMLQNLIHMDLENHIPVQIKPRPEKCQNDARPTSEKVRQLIAKFPSSKPMTDDLLSFGYCNANSCRKCLNTSLQCDSHPIPLFPANLETDTNNGGHYVGSDPVRIQPLYHNDQKSRAWTAVTEVMQLLQIVVTATAFALYYIIYGWMQVVYHGLRIAVYFKDSDGPMKITIGVVAVTSIVVGFNMLLRIRKIYSDILR